MLHVGSLGPCVATFVGGEMPSHQALLLQAQDDEIEDQDTERQHAPIQYPKLADIMGEEFRNDEVFS